MGMESFFVIILPKSVVHFKDEYGVNIYKGVSNINYHDIKNTFDNIENIIYIDIPKLLCHIRNKYLLAPCFENNKLLYINIEACLWYLSNDNNEINNLLSYFLHKGYNVFHPGIGLLNSNINDFINHLRDFYKEKCDIFISKYSKYFKEEAVLPGSYFYKKIVTIQSI
jgi:hypothetical protein